MKITFTIENDNGEVIGSGSSNTIEMAVQELYRFENHPELLTDKADVMAESLSEEAEPENI